MAREGVAAFGRRGYLRREVIDTLLANLRPGGKSGMTNMAWDLLILEQWLQCHADRPKASRQGGAAGGGISDRPSPSRRETVPAV
jgi:hypothetical protein